MAKAKYQVANRYKTVLTSSLTLVIWVGGSVPLQTAPSVSNGKYFFITLDPLNSTNVNELRCYMDWWIVKYNWYDVKINKTYWENTSVQIWDVAEMINEINSNLDFFWAITQTWGLWVSIDWGNIAINWVEYNVANKSLTLSDNTTNYIVLDYTETVSANIIKSITSLSWFVWKQLYTITTSWGSITSITDNYAQDNRNILNTNYFEYVWWKLQPKTTLLNEITHTNRATLDAISWTNTWDETTSSIKTKLSITWDAVWTQWTQTITQKNINLLNNTITWTSTEFNTACSDKNFIFEWDAATKLSMSSARLLWRTTTWDWSIEQIVIWNWLTLSSWIISNSNLSNTAQTLTNKTIALQDNTIFWTIAQFNTACSDADFATGWWTATWINTWDQTLNWLMWYETFTVTGTVGGMASKTLNSSSAYNQFIVGDWTWGCAIYLPNTSTISIWKQFKIINKSASDLYIVTSNSYMMLTAWKNTSAIVTCISTSSNLASAWQYEYNWVNTPSYSVLNVSWISSISWANTWDNATNTKYDYLTWYYSYSWAELFLSNSSPMYIKMSHTAQSKLILPQATSLLVWRTFRIINRSPADFLYIHWYFNQSVSLYTLWSGWAIFFTCIDNGSDAEASWLYH